MSQDATEVMREVYGDQAKQDGTIDPRGLLPHEPGAKLDGGKVDLTLVPPQLTDGVARVMMFGVEKYSRGGWMHVPDAGVRYFAALKRHIHAIECGEDIDPETGLPHLNHIATNAAFLMALSEVQDVVAWRDLPSPRDGVAIGERVEAKS